MHQSEVINEIIASYLVGERLVRQKEHFPCGAIIFTEQHKICICFMTLLLCWNIYREKMDCTSYLKFFWKLREFLALLQWEQEQLLNFAHVVRIVQFSAFYSSNT